MPVPTIDTSGVSDGVIALAAKWLTPYNNIKTFLTDLTAGNAGVPVERLLWGTQSAAIAGTTLSAITKKYVIVDTDGSASQNLATISGPVQGHEIVLEMANAGRVVTVKHGTGNIFLWGGADVVLGVGKVLHLFRTSTGWSDVFIPPAAYVLPTQAMVINTVRTALGGSAASVTISSIPATYKHLLLLLELRTDVAAITDNIVVRFNADATVGNYFSQFGFVANATLTAAENLGTVYGGCLIGSIAAGNTAPANTNGFAAIYIANYASASLQRMLSYHGGVRGAATTGTLRAASGAGWWINAAAAISSITILPNGGTNLVANSAYTLYGLN